MIEIVVLLISFLAFLINIRLLQKDGKYPSRLGLTGGETARHILGESGFSQIAVDPGRESTHQSTIKQFYLDPAIYHGKTLLDVASAAYEAVFIACIPNASFMVELRRRVSDFLVPLIPAAWAALFLSLLAPHLVFLKFFGMLVFAGTFLSAVLILPVEFEACDRAFLLLKQSQHFQVDELARLKSLLHALRLNGLGQIFKTPLIMSYALMKGKLRAA